MCGDFRLTIEPKKKEKAICFIYSVLKIVECLEMNQTEAVWTCLQVRAGPKSRCMDVMREDINIDYLREKDAKDRIKCS